MTLTSKERVARVLARRPHDRVPLFDWFWMETEAAFIEQLGDPRLRPEAGVERLTLTEYFDMDIVQVGWPVTCLRLSEPEVLDESDEWVLQRDGNGAVLRWWKHKMGTPEHVSYGIDTPEKWAAVKHLLAPSRDRVRWEEQRIRYQRAREAGRFICYSTNEIFELGMALIGHERMLKAMLKQPEWIHDLFGTYVRWQIDIFELIEAEGLACDGAFIYGDMAYKTGPFMSPRHYREFLQPYHRRLFDEFHRRNMPVVFHSDGDIRIVLDDLVAAGVDAINPLESRAGMDVRELAPRYGDRLSFVGNIDVTVLATNDREQIRPEVHSKMQAAMPYHGFIYHSDHSIPPGVTLETYRWLLDEVRAAGRYA